MPHCQHIVSVRLSDVQHWPYLARSTHRDLIRKGSCWSSSCLLLLSSELRYDLRVLKPSFLCCRRLFGVLEFLDVEAAALARQIYNGFQGWGLPGLYVHPPPLTFPAKRPLEGGAQLCSPQPRPSVATCKFPHTDGIAGLLAS